MRFHTVLSTLLIVILAAPVAAQEIPRYDMQQCLTRAIAANPQMASAKQQIYGAQEGVRAAGAAFLPVGTATYTSVDSWTKIPQANSSSLATLTNVQTATPTSYSWKNNNYIKLLTLDLNVSQPLFTGFRLLSSFQQAKLAKEQADALYRRTELTLLRSVETAFLTLLQARANVKSNQDSVTRLRSQLQVTQAFYDVGLRPRLDVLQAQSDLATAEEGLLSAQNSVDIQLVQLNSLLNIPLDQNVEYVGELDYAPFTMALKDALDEAYKNRPDVYIALKSVEIAEKSATIALSPALPQLSASYDYIRQSDQWGMRQDPSLSSSRGSFADAQQVTLTASWRAWDWGNTMFTYRQAQDATRKLQADLGNLRLTVGLDVKTQYLNIQDAAKRIMVARTGVDAAAEGYRMAVARYQAQVGTNTDVLTSQAQLSRAEFQLTQAMTDFRIAIANLFYSIGRKSLTLS
jgi:outer membrane protein TolC